MKKHIRMSDYSMRYVCLLRGINVGGNNLVSMKILKDLLLKDGFLNVVTYINSGNIIFDWHKDDHELSQRIEKIIFDGFGVMSKVLVLNENQYMDVVNQIPIHFVNNDEFKADVIFYLEGVTEEMIKTLKFRPEIEEVIYLKNALIYGIKRENQTKSALIKIVGTKFYYNVTIRNVNTSRRLAELLIS